jgi:hypothetical protein
MAGEAWGVSSRSDDEPARLGWCSINEPTSAARLDGHHLVARDVQRLRRGRGDGQDRSSYDWRNHVASWVDKTRGQSNSLVSHGDTVCSTRAHDLYRLDGHSGDEIFTERLPGTATSPSLAEDILVVGDDSTAAGVLYGLSLDGQKLWSLPLVGCAPDGMSAPGRHLGDHRCGWTRRGRGRLCMRPRRVATGRASNSSRRGRIGRQ